MDAGESHDSKSLTRIELHEIFKECKETRFSKEPDFAKVLEIVSNKLDVLPSDKLMVDIQDEFKNYTEISRKNRKLTSSNRIEVKVCLVRNKYSPRQKTPLNDVSDRQQRRRLSDFVSSTQTRAQEEGVSPSKLHAFALKRKHPFRKKSW